MSTVVTSLTASRMQEIEAASVVDGDVVGGHLILSKHDGTQIDAGSVVGPSGPQGPAGIAITGIPGEIKMWPGNALPDPVKYGKWTWANGGAFDISAYPLAAANIDPAWNTAQGLPNPGAGKFRVPDLRGSVPVCLDALPVGSARANRTTRAPAIVMAAQTGREYVGLTVNDIPRHTHPISGITDYETSDHTHGTPGLPVPINYNRVSTGAGGGGNNYVTGLTGGGAGTVALNTATPASNTYGRSAAHQHTFSATAGNNASSETQHENLPPSVFVPYIVKLDD